LIDQEEVALMISEDRGAELTLPVLQRGVPLHGGRIATGSGAEPVSNRKNLTARGDQVSQLANYGHRLDCSLNLSTTQAPGTSGNSDVTAVYYRTYLLNVRGPSPLGTDMRVADLHAGPDRLATYLAESCQGRHLLPDDHMDSKSLQNTIHIIA
jgi:hypothetical protein